MLYRLCDVNLCVNYGMILPIYDYIRVHHTMYIDLHNI